MAAECVKVIVRCRPINERERNLNCINVIKIDQSRGTCGIQPPQDAKSPPKLFTFDGAYALDATTEQIYADIAYPLVEGVTEGYNGTIFAYGQTGCGKSFTMQGIPDPATQRGIIPRAFEHIFETVSVSETKFLIQSSYLEIYNEEIRDLLGNNIKAKLELKEHPEKGVYVNGLSKFTVHSVRECESLMERGWKNRSTGATLMNTDSSRSHSIFTISVEMCRVGEDGEDHIRAGKLNLVDLAGSERQSKTGATGDRLREATKINLSLSALGNVISSLVDGKSTHIPYRDSKLTRLLQDSLGGNTKTLMVACLSPADNNYEESLSTLRYANRAKNIKNKPKINEDPKDALLREYQEEIKKLKAMLAGQMPVTERATAAAPEPQVVEKVVHVDYSTDIEEEKQKIREEYERQLSDLNSMYETERVTKTKLQDDMQKLREFYDLKIRSVDGKYANLPPPGAKIAGQTTTAPEQEESVVPPAGPPQRAVYLGSTVAPQEPVAPGVAPGPATGQQAQEALKRPSLMNSEAAARDRLQELELQMVGGENINNTEVKERRKKKRKHAEEKRRKLAEANSNLEDDGIMEGIFDSIHDELRAKNKLLEKEKQRSSALERELIDVQSEFEFDRVDYLDTVRKQEKEIGLLKALLEKIQPCIRRDCNYSNLDRIKLECKYDDDEQAWVLPTLKVEKTSLPSGPPGGGGGGGSSHGNGRPSYTDTDDEEDRYKQRLQRSNKQEVAKNYFSSKRVDRLLNEQQDIRHGQHEVSGYQNGYVNGNSHLPPSGAPAWGQDSFSNMGDLRAAQVHGQFIDPDQPMRKPVRLSSLQPTPSAKKSKKRNKAIEF